jgi:hypothetical protein
MARPSRTAALNLDVSHALTRDMIDNRLVCPPGKMQAFLRDAASPSLRVRVTAAGAKSFVFEAKLKRSTVRITIGDVRAWTIEQARIESNRLRTLVDRGLDPRAERRQYEAQMAAQAAAEEAARRAEEARQRHTLEALCAEYCNWLEQQGKESHGDARNILTNHLITRFPEIAKTPACLVEKRQIVEPVRKLTEAGKLTTARKLRAYLRAAYACAVKADSDPTLPSAFVPFAVTTNPVEAVAAIRSSADKNPLSLADLRRYWKALQEEPGEIGAALRLILLSGAQRVAQLARLHAPEDASDGNLRLWDRKGKRSEPRLHLLPITKHMRAELDKLPAHGFVLSTDGGKTPMHPTSLSAWASAVGDKAKIRDFQLKRVRSGVETALASIGISMDVRGQLQSHGISGVQAKHYDAHEYLPEKRKALSALYNLLERSEANVTPLKRMRA